jgi:hypothetical protein
MNHASRIAAYGNLGTALIVAVGIVGNDARSLADDGRSMGEKK